MKIICDESNNTEADMQNRVIHIDIEAETAKDTMMLNCRNMLNYYVQSTNQEPLDNIYEDSICKCEIPKPRDMKSYNDKGGLVICKNCGKYILARKE